MSSIRPVGAPGAVRLLLLTVLLGLFGMHVLTAHGADHHGVATVTSTAPGHDGAGHHVGSLDATAGGAMAMDASHASATGAGSMVAAPGAPSDGAGLLACWLLITAGVALIAMLLRGRRIFDAGVRNPLSVGGARPGRPRAPPGRERLHELTVLRV